MILPVLEASQNKRINEIVIDSSQRNIPNFIADEYKAAPFYSNVIELLIEIYSFENDCLSDFLENSLRIISAYIGIEFNCIKASELISADSNLGGQSKILEVMQALNGTTYINLPGGSSLYSEQAFSEFGYDLRFIEVEHFSYERYGKLATSDLSIIDILMFNSKELVKAKLI